MEIKIDFTKSAQENAEEYYDRAKRLTAKRKGAERAIAELKGMVEKAKAEKAAEVEKVKPAVTVSRPKEWYEKFRWFTTSDGMLVIGGRDAHQNEALNSRHFEAGDLFFHANIFGASVTVLKGGESSPERSRSEAAQFAACYSSAWKEGLQTVDVYAMRRTQVSKSTGKGSLGVGSFLLSGEREWHRDTPLGLAMFMADGRLNTVPLRLVDSAASGSLPQKVAAIRIGRDKKSDAAKKISRMIGCDDIDEIIRQLPAGEFRVGAGGLVTPRHINTT